MDANADADTKEQLRRGETPPKFTYVEETAFDAEGLSEALIGSRGY